MNEDGVLELVYEAMDEINEHLMVTAQLPKAQDTIILGEGGSLDSLGVVNLLAAIEDKLEAGGNTRISPLSLIADEESAENLRTVDTLVRALMGENVHK